MSFFYTFINFLNRQKMVNFDYVKGTKIQSYKHFVNFLFGDVVIKTRKDKENWQFIVYVKPKTFDTDARRQFKGKFEEFFKGVKVIEVDE